MNVFIWVDILSCWRKGDVHHTGPSPLATPVPVCLHSYLHFILPSPRSPWLRHLGMGFSLLIDPPRSFLFGGLSVASSCNGLPPACHMSGSLLIVISELRYHIPETYIIYILQPLPHTLAWVLINHIPLFDSLLVYIPCCGNSSTLRSAWHIVGIQQLLNELTCPSKSIRDRINKCDWC